MMAGCGGLGWHDGMVPRGLTLVCLMHREEGFRGFWKGLSASYWGCSEGCIQFVVYEKLKKSLLEK